MTKTTILFLALYLWACWEDRNKVEQPVEEEPEEETKPKSLWDSELLKIAGIKCPFEVVEGEEVPFDIVTYDDDKTKPTREPIKLEINQ